MIKHIIALVAISIMVVMGMAYAQQGVNYLIQAHDWIGNLLTDVFSMGQTGNMIRNCIALLLVPFVVALIPSVIYWGAKRHWFPYFMQTTWIIWLIEVGALAISYMPIAVMN